VDDRPPPGALLDVRLDTLARQRRFGKGGRVARRNGRRHARGLHPTVSPLAVRLGCGPRRRREFRRVRPHPILMAGASRG